MKNKNWQNQIKINVSDLNDIEPIDELEYISKFEKTKKKKHFDDDIIIKAKKNKKQKRVINNKSQI